MKWISILVLASCFNPVAGQELDGKHHPANQYMHRNNFDEVIKRFEDPSRETWQKPEEVLKLFGDVRHKTVLDIGAGTGYFSFRLADLGARVIAADVDENFQSYIQQKKKEQGYTDDQIQLKKIPYHSPQLDSETIDLALIVNTYHHIHARTAYFEQVFEGLQPGGALMVVDFKKELPEDAPGPPKEMRISASQVMKELKASGFKNFTENEELLEFQYIILAYK